MLQRLLPVLFLFWVMFAQGFQIYKYGRKGTAPNFPTSRLLSSSSRHKQISRIFAAIEKPDTLRRGGALINEENDDSWEINGEDEDLSEEVLRDENIDTVESNTMNLVQPEYYNGGNRYGRSLDTAPSLVLNADYTPISYLPLSLWHWQDALRAVISNKAVVVNEYNIVVRSVRMSFKLPSVIALKDFQKKTTQSPPLSRRLVFIRDGFKCQYCNVEFAPERLSLDHVIPRSKGGKLTWTNTVCACQICNTRKGSRTLDEISRLGMKLKTMPHTPTFSEIQQKSRSFKKNNLHPHWREFI